MQNRRSVVRLSVRGQARLGEEVYPIANISLGGLSLAVGDIGDWTERPTPATVTLDRGGTELTFRVRLQFRYFHAASGHAGFEFDGLAPEHRAALATLLNDARPWQWPATLHNELGVV